MRLLATTDVRVSASHRPHRRRSNNRLPGEPQPLVVQMHTVSVDTEAVRSFVRASELGQLQHAADELGVTQQAVSKRIATLERELDVRLFTRTARGVELTLDGQAFLPHARTIVTAVDRAIAAIRQGSRALRIDVLGLRTAQAVVLHDYWRSHPDTNLDVVTLGVNDPRAAVAAVQAGDIDASFRSVTDPATLPRDVQMIHAFDSPLELLVGPRHPLASARTLTPSQLRQHRIWVPGIAPRSEVGGVLRSARHRLRPPHRRRGAKLRQRGTPRHPRGLHRRGNPRGLARPVRLADELRPTPDPDRETGARVPSLAHPSPSEPTPRAPGGHRPPRKPDTAPRDGLAPILGTDTTHQRRRQLASSAWQHGSCRST